MSLEIRLKTEIPLRSVKIKSPYTTMFTNASYRVTKPLEVGEGQSAGH
jgi:hypothetical protein